MLLFQLSFPKLMLAFLSWFAGVSVCVYLFVSRRHRRKRAPLVPGIPLIGNVLNVDRKHPHLSLTALARDYGAIYRIRILTREMVIVNSRDLIQEVLQNKDNTLAGRPDFFRIQYGFHNAKDLIFGTYDAKWVTLKKVTSQLVRHYATGRDNVEAMVRDEMRALVARFDETEGRDFDPALVHLTAVVNAISAAVS